MHRCKKVEVLLEELQDNRKLELQPEDRMHQLVEGMVAQLVAGNTGRPLVDMPDRERVGTVDWELCFC